MLLQLLILLPTFASLICGQAVDSKKEMDNGTSLTKPLETPMETLEDVHLNYRLPSSLRPCHYAIRLQPFINGNFSIHGSVEITFEVLNATSVVTLQIRDIITLNETVKVYSRQDDSDSFTIQKQTYDKELDFYRVFLDGIMEEGQEYVIALSYKGVLNRKLKGFYPSSYKDGMGNTRWLAATQFQIKDARKAFPCFDEPSLKANFSVQLLREKNMSSHTNMHKITTLPVEGQPGWFVDSFETSVPMSTYIVAFMISDLAHVNSSLTDDVLFRVWSRRSALEQLNYSLVVGPELLHFYEDFLNETYPLRKLDMVALPDFSFGAMENWGLVNYREALLVYDPLKSSAQNKWSVGHIIAHELAHMWFGNLVTPEWWSEIWLSEGFANYMETLGLDAVEPSYGAYEECIIRSSRSAFQADSTTNSHPLSFATDDPSVLDDIISGIVYHKAGTLLRMVTYALTQEVFQEGLMAFVRRFSYASAVSEDLWGVLNEYAQQEDLLPGLPPLEEIMHNWTFLNGYPVLNVNVQDNGTACLSQHRFLFVQPKDQRLLNYKWWIPITFTTQDEPDFSQTKPDLWLSPSDEKKIIDGMSANGGWVIFNIHQNGFYRVNYNGENWRKIIHQFQTNHSVISSVNRAQIIGDVFQLAKAGLLPYSIPLELIGYLNKETDLVPLKAAFDELKMLEDLLKNSESYPLFEKYSSSWIKSLFNQIGFEDDLSSSNRDQRKRSLIVKESCSRDHKPCLVKSLNLFMEWMADPSNESIISPNLQDTVWCSAIQQGTEREWNFLWTRYISSNVGSEKTRLMKALACTNNHAIRKLYLEKAFTPNSEIKSQDSAFVFKFMSKTTEGAKFAWSYLVKNFTRIYEYIGYSRTIGSMIKGSTRFFNSAQDLKQLKNLIAKDKELKGPGAASTQQVVEEIEGRIKWMNKNYKSVVQWLEEKTGTTILL